MPTSPALHPFDYAVIRVVPRVERGEFLNAGVILFCRTQRFLAARTELDHTRLLVLDPHSAPADVQQHLELIPRICAGGSAGGIIGQLSLSERFHWLVAPRSTIIQTSPVHGGLCADAAAMLDHLFCNLVRLPPRGT
jgi:hypothetical protein